MKERIRQIMELQKMTQQVFAAFLGMSPATLSSILTGRTHPTLQVVNAVKNKIPTISTDWLMFGKGEMFEPDAQDNATTYEANSNDKPLEPMLAFGNIEPEKPTVQRQPTAKDESKNERIAVVNNIDKIERKITEIRIFYDDQTWETFLPKK